MANLKPERPNLRPERPDLRPEGPDLRPERLDFRPRRLDLRPKMTYLRPEMPYLMHERPDFRPEGLDEGGDEQTNGRTNESPPVFYRTSSPLGPLPKSRVLVVIITENGGSLLEHTR